VKVSNGVVAEAPRVSGVVPVGDEAAARRIESVEAAAISADPERAVLAGL